MQNRRQFLGAIGLPSVAVSTALRSGPCELGEIVHAIAATTATTEQLVADEDFWLQVGQAFAVDRSLVNLNNGGVSPTTTFAMAAHKRHLDFSNEAPGYTMWRVLEPQKEAVRARLARQFGCDAEELAITRNASEGLQICQLGFDLARGDQVLCTNQDYPRMINTWKQRAAREGIELVTFSIPTPCDDPARIVELYRQHITEKTRVILVCHVINLTGQIMPVREVVALGRERGIPVIVDGAHAFANVDASLSDLDCDYYATSLHKWLFAPIGTGFLFVRRSKIRSLWPLMAGLPEQVEDIRKFEQFGTHPVGPFLAIAEALTFHEAIGSARKFARLVHLRDLWARRLLATGRIRLHTSLSPGAACGIATVEVDGFDSLELSAKLVSEHRILTTPIVHEDFHGIRVSPSVYTTTGELDRFCRAIESL
jgi:selenocysteine lyase/cysteine desulfurase